MIAQIGEPKPSTGLVISWEALPGDFRLEDDPVENTGQPLLAGALRESLEIAGFIQPQMLVASNFALCATVNGQFIAKAPDWVYVANVSQILPERKSYTPNLEGDIPRSQWNFYPIRKVVSIRSSGHIPLVNGSFTNKYYKYLFTLSLNLALVCWSFTRLKMDDMN